jgi:HlyD family secretion protein
MAQAAYDQAVSGYKAALARYNQALASLKQIKRSAERTTITAPIDGVVTSLSVEEGENVVGTAQMQGTEMMRVSDLSVMNAVVEVDENDIVMVKNGDTARVEVDALPDNIYNGVVIEIGHSAIVSSLGTQDQVTNFEVKIRLIDEEPRLRPGMSCNVDIETKTRRDVIAVPLMAVTVRAEDFDRSPDVREGERGLRKKENKESGVSKVKRPPSVVFIKDGNKVKKKEVKTGISDKGYIEITEGLEEGQTIVSGSYQAVSKQLHDGAEIKVDTSAAKNKFKH